MNERQADQLLETLDTLEMGLLIMLALGGILMLFVIADLVGMTRDWWRARHAPAPVLFDGEAYLDVMLLEDDLTEEEAEHLLRDEAVGDRLDPSLPSPHPTEFEFVGKVEKSPDVRGVLKGGGLG